MQERAGWAQCCARDPAPSAGAAAATLRPTAGTRWLGAMLRKSACSKRWRCCSNSEADCRNALAGCNAALMSSGGSLWPPPPPLLRSALRPASEPRRSKRWRCCSSSDPNRYRLVKRSRGNPSAAGERRSNLDRADRRNALAGCNAALMSSGGSLWPPPPPLLRSALHPASEPRRSKRWRCCSSSDPNSYRSVKRGAQSTAGERRSEVKEEAGRSPSRGT